MIEHGARHFIYLSRSAGRSETDKSFIRELEFQGCSVQAIAGSVAERGVVEQAVKQAVKPIKGVLQLSMAIPNLAFLDMKFSDWKAGLAAKVKETWNLHCILSDDLDFFILASSIGGCFGHIGQANYAAANTFLDAFVHYRHSHDRPASVVDIGLIGDMGYIAEHPAVYEQFRAAGSYFVGEQEVLDSIHWAIVNSGPNTSQQLRKTSHLTMGVRPQKSLSDPTNYLPWARDMRMAIYHNIDVSNSSNSTSSTDSLKAFITLLKAEPSRLNDKDSLDIVTREIGIRLYTSLLKPVDELDITVRLESLGVDSLVLIEMRNWCKRSFGGVEFSTLDFLNAGTIQGIGILAIDGLKKKFFPGSKDEQDVVPLPNASVIRNSSALSNNANFEPEDQTDTSTLSENSKVLENKTAPPPHIDLKSDQKEIAGMPTWLPPVFIPKEDKEGNIGHLLAPYADTAAGPDWHI